MVRDQNTGDLMRRGLSGRCESGKRSRGKQHHESLCREIHGRTPISGVSTDKRQGRSGMRLWRSRSDPLSQRRRWGGVRLLLGDHDAKPRDCVNGKVPPCRRASPAQTHSLMRHQSYTHVSLSQREVVGFAVRGDRRHEQRTVSEALVRQLCEVLRWRRQALSGAVQRQSWRPGKSSEGKHPYDAVSLPYLFVCRRLRVLITLTGAL